MKRPRKRKFEPYKQGLYKPINKHKYVGKKIPRYLSSWELKFFKWCDRNSNVVKWSSESIVIPYVSAVDGRIHNYMVDNMVHIQEGAKIIKYLIEIKPYKQTQKPVPSKRKKRSTILYENTMYLRNISKWKSAQEWCNKKGYKFLILTERELFSERYK